MVVANAYGNLLSLSTSSYWYSPKMNLTCSSLLTFRLSEGGTYRSRRAFADLALGRTEFNPKHRIIFRCQEVFVRDWSLMIWIHPDTFFQRRVTVAFWHLSRIWPSQLAPILSAVSFHKFILLLMSHEFDRCILSCLMSFRGTSCCALLRPLPLWSNWTQDVRCSYYNKWQILGSDDAAA